MFDGSKLREYGLEVAFVVYLAANYILESDQDSSYDSSQQDLVLGWQEI
jgi:hypothetical protein